MRFEKFEFFRSRKGIISRNDSGKVILPDRKYGDIIKNKEYFCKLVEKPTCYIAVVIATAEVSFDEDKKVFIRKYFDVKTSQFVGSEELPAEREVYEDCIGLAIIRTVLYRSPENNVFWEPKEVIRRLPENLEERIEVIKKDYPQFSYKIKWWLEEEATKKKIKESSFPKTLEEFFTNSSKVEGRWIICGTAKFDSSLADEVLNFPSIVAKVWATEGWFGYPIDIIFKIPKPETIYSQSRWIGLTSGKESSMIANDVSNEELEASEIKKIKRSFAKEMRNFKETNETEEISLGYGVTAVVVEKFKKRIGVTSEFEDSARHSFWTEHRYVYAYVQKYYVVVDVKGVHDDLKKYIIEKVNGVIQSGI
ncbi:MAG: hypothetical protein QXH07_03845 [Thermoplasmata archaeon]